MQNKDINGCNMRPLMKWALVMVAVQTARVLVRYDEAAMDYQSYSSYSVLYEPFVQLYVKKETNPVNSVNNLLRTCSEAQALSYK